MLVRVAFQARETQFRISAGIQKPAVTTSEIHQYRLDFFSSENLARIKVAGTHDPLAHHPEKDAFLLVDRIRFVEPGDVSRNWRLLRHAAKTTTIVIGAVGLL